MSVNLSLLRWYHGAVINLILFNFASSNVTIYGFFLPLRGAQRILSISLSLHHVVYKALNIHLSKS